VEDAHVVKLIDIYRYLARGVANRLTVDAADEAGVIKGSKRAVTRCPDRDAVTDAFPQTGAGLVTDSHVETTVNVITERVIPDSCVTGARYIVLHRKVTERIVFAAVIVHERVAPVGVVEETAHVGSNGEGTDSIVVGATVVMDERISSNGRILVASGVEQQRCSANCGVVIRVVGSWACG